MTPMLRRLLWQVYLAIGLASGPALALPPLLPGQFQAYVEDDRYELHHAPQALVRFDAMLAAAGPLATLPDEALYGLATDAAAANFYFAGARVDAHRSVFDELARRARPSTIQVEDMHRSLIAARRWQDAVAFAGDHPDVPLEELPVHFDDEGGDAADAHYWRIDESGARLTRTPLAMTRGVTLVVVSHPDCHFSHDALTAIEADPALDQALPKNRLFVAPAPVSLTLERIAQWNAAHPRSRHVLVDRPQAWPFVRQWSTPQFFFLVDGQLVAQVEGWPKEGRAEELMAAAREAAR